MKLKFQKKRLSYLIKSNKIKVLNNTLVMFGGIWLLIECPSSLSDNFKDITTPYSELILTFSILISCVYGIVKSFPKLYFEQHFKSSNTSVTIKVSNLLDETGDIAISSSDYFDTDYDIESNISLKSQIINSFFNKDLLNVDRLIEKSLIEQNLVGESVNGKPRGKKIRYPIGSIACLDHMNRKIYIVILTNLIFVNQQKHTQTDAKKLNLALDSLWNMIKTEGRMREISIPILGSGLASLTLSHLLIIQYIILSFVIYSKNTRITNNINIIIGENNYDPDDFEEAVNFLKSIKI